MCKTHFTSCQPGQWANDVFPKMWNIGIDNYVVGDSNICIKFLFPYQVIDTVVVGTFCDKYWRFTLWERRLVLLAERPADGQVWSHSSGIVKQNS